MDSNILTQLADLSEDVFALTYRVLEKAEHGALKGQKLDHNDRACGTSTLKPVLFRHFILLDAPTKSSIIKELLNNERDIKSFKKETQILHKLKVELILCHLLVLFIEAYSCSVF